MRDRIEELNKIYAHVDALTSRYPSLSVTDAIRLYLDELAIEGVQSAQLEQLASIDSPDYEERDVWSSCIKTVGYDRRAKSLVINWTPDKKWKYLNVPEAEYRELLEAPSCGRFVNSEIKGRYQGIRVN
jgi:hypothetical protein